MIVFDDKCTMIYSVDAKAAIVTAAAGATAPVLNESNAEGQGDIYPWGGGNDRPNEIIRACQHNSIIPSTLAWKAEALYGGGLAFGYLEVQNGQEVLVAADPAKHPEVNAFRNSIVVKRYLRQASKAYYWFKNIFPELVLSKDRKKIVSIASQRPEYCRYVREKDNIVRKVAIDANWIGGSTTLDKKTTTVVDLLDVYNDPVERLRADAGGRPKVHKYIYPVMDSSPGTTFYQTAEWHSILKSGWLEVAQSIPAFKRALFKNQISIKYLVEVSTEWWEWKYPGFNEFDTERKKTIMRDERKRFEDFMAGEEAAGKSLMVTVFNDPQQPKAIPGWQITAIDNKIKDGVYIEDSQEASSHIMYALAVDPVLRGFTPGGTMASGGSEKRVAWNNHIMMTKPHQDDILEPLEFIRDFNGWDPNIRFWFRNYYQATMDVAREPQQMSS